MKDGGEGTDLPDGFYDSAKANEIYSAGYIAGKANSDKVMGKVTYHLVHQHVDGKGIIHGSEDYVLPEDKGGCYTKPGTYKKSVFSHMREAGKIHHPGTGKISKYWCGYENNPGDGFCDMDDSWDETIWEPVYVNVDEPCFYPGCGHVYHDSEGTTMDYDKIKATQQIKSIDLQLITE